MRLSRTVPLLVAATAASCALAGCSSSGHPAGGATGASGVSIGASVTSDYFDPGRSASGPDPSASSIGPSSPGSGPSIQPGTSAPFPTPSDGKGAAAATDQTHVLDTLPGHGGRGCVEVGSRADVRSGSVAAGNFVTARHTYASGTHTVFLYLIPQHATVLHRATITLTPRGGGAARTITSTQLDQADQWQYFSVDLPVAAAGAYRLRMTAGADSGCFDVTFAA